ncbi:P-loop containing nucleoside triphosphate hydrolase protein, partial [Circinella umbellata]
SESGTISRVEMCNFMCHTYLAIDLGPKINFVIGHNGSGKSAIMTALTIALGAKASSTNRGKNLSALICEGANAALITVHITNKGPDAYRHDVYGDTIIIDRKILKDGSGQYKIKSSSGKTISLKREELTTICDHMSIQVDNPLIVLSQDNAREFLNSSSPKDKYKLFMRGTQLTALHEDYDEIGEKLTTTDTIIDRKRRAIPDLRKKADETKLRYDEALERDKLEDQLEVLSNELAWVQVILKEKEVALSQKNRDAAERQVTQAKEKLVAIKVSYINVISAPSLHYFFFKKKRQSDEYQASISLNVEGKRNENRLKSDINKINSLVKSTKTRVAQLEKTIQVETAKQEASSQAINDERLEKLEALQRTKEQKERESRQCKDEIGDIEVKLTELTAERNGFANKFDQKERQRKSVRDKIDSLRQQKSNTLRAFGRFMPEVLHDINEERGWTRKPVGPFGRFVTLKNPEYTETMELVLGKVLNSFVVETYDDRKRLTRILERRNMSDTIVLVSRYDLFDYSRGEPDPKYLTMLRALEFKDEWVKRQLIVARDIEKCLLIKERIDAQSIMEGGGPENVKQCYTSRAQKITGHQGLKKYPSINIWGSGDIKYIFFYREAHEQLKEIEKEYNELKRERQQVGEKIDKCRNQMKTLQNKQYNIEREIRNILYQIKQVEESMQEEEPVDIQIYKDEKDVSRKQKSYIGQFQVLRQQDQEIRVEIQEIMVRIQQYETEEEAHEVKMREFQRNIQGIENLRMKTVQKANQTQEAYDHCVMRHKEMERKADLDERTVAEWTRQVIEEWPNRVETRRSPDQIQKQIRHLEMRIEERNKAIGASLEEIEQEARDALEALRTAKGTVRLLDTYRANLRDTLAKRLDHWNAFRMYISLSAQGHFTYFMHQRGYNGYLKFNHDKERLDIRVSTGDQFKRGSRHKDSKTLSGGEKSFSQISLLLSLWEGISSPLYCLDEFDVYMDAVNRKKSMQMMMEAAMDNDSQYIFITPQDASNMVPGPHIKVHRLSDPEREQL